MKKRLLILKPLQPLRFFLFRFCFCFFVCTGLLSTGVGFLACTKQNSPRFTLLDRDMNYEANELFKHSIDILWVVDNSHTMKKYQELLLSKMDSFLEVFSKFKINFHLGITSMDMRPTETGGQLIGSPAILTPGTPDWETLFKERFLLGDRGSPRERGLDSMEVLLTQHENFIRPEVPLVIIFVSDEEDASLEETNHYIDFLNALKTPHPFSQKKGWQVHFFGILSKEDRGGNCYWTETQRHRVKPGTRYMELVTASGGMATSICSNQLNFQEILFKIKEKAAHFLRTTPLTKNP